VQLSPQDTYQVAPASDSRISINPSMQLLDYMTNARYGKGLGINSDINLDSFLESGRLCDDRSEVTLVTTTQAPVNAIYSWSKNGLLGFRGVVKSSTERVTSSGVFYETVFEDVIGKLGRKWADWKQYDKDELIWYLNKVIVAPTDNYSITEAAWTSVSTVNDTTLTRVDVAGSLTVTFARLGGLKNTNSIVRAWNPGEEAFSNPGYSLHDCDDVLYWKYLGWEEQEQHWVTRHQTNQVVNTSTPIFDNINSMLKQFNGILRYSNGKYALDVKTGAAPDGSEYWREGITTISEDDIIGSIKLDDKGQRQSHNSISANIVDPQNKYGTRAISYFNSNYLKEDKGIPSQGTYSMPGVTNYYTARTNIIQYLDESRYGLTVGFTMDPKAYLLLPGNIVALNYNRFNWVNKLFRIVALTLQPNGLVALVAEEHNDDAFKISYSDRTPMEFDTPPVPPSPTVLQPPTNLQATGNGGTNTLEGRIVLTWDNSATYDAQQGNQRIEIWAVEGEKTGDPLEYTYISPPFANASLIDVTDGTSYTHDFDDGSDAFTYYYWIRYVQYRNDRPANFSLFEPRSDQDGVEGRSLVPETEAGYTITIDPSSALLEADSFGAVPVGGYTETGTTIRVMKAGQELDSVASSPGDQQFSVTATPKQTTPGTNDIIAGTPVLTGLPYVAGEMSSFLQYIPPANTVVLGSTNITYTLDIEGVITHTITQPIAKLIEGADAWQINGTNSTHIFIANSDGIVDSGNNDFTNIPNVVKLGQPYTYDGTDPYGAYTFRYGTVTADPAKVIVNINTATDGEISITSGSGLLTDGDIISATIDIELIDNDTGLVFGVLSMLLTKA
jgi:hypothetical protein